MRLRESGLHRFSSPSCLYQTHLVHGGKSPPNERQKILSFEFSREPAVDQHITAGYVSTAQSQDRKLPALKIWGYSWLVALEYQENRGDFSGFYGIIGQVLKLHTQTNP